MGGGSGRRRHPVQPRAVSLLAKIVAEAVGAVESGSTGGDMPTEAESQFNEAMLNLYRRAKAEAGYNATRFLSMVVEHGGLETARYLLHATTVSEGYTALSPSRLRLFRFASRCSSRINRPRTVHRLPVGASPPVGSTARKMPGDWPVHPVRRRPRVGAIMGWASAGGGNDG